MPRPFYRMIPGSHLSGSSATSGNIARDFADYLQSGAFGSPLPKRRIPQQASSMSPLGGSRSPSSYLGIGLGLGQFQGGLGSLGSTDPTIGSVGGGALGVLGGAATMAGSFAGGPAGSALMGIGIAAKFGEVLFDSTDKLNKWTRSLVDSNLRLGEFSPEMARLKGMQTLFDLQRAQRTGAGTAKTAEDLLLGEEERAKKFDPDRIELINIKNQIANKLGDMTMGAYSGLKQFGRWTYRLTNLDPDTMTPDKERQIQENIRQQQMLGRPERFRSSAKFD